MNSDFQFKKAKWIWQGEKKDNQYVDFVVDFSCETANAALYISAKTDYATWLNGEFLSSGQYGDFPNMKSVDVIDLSKKLVKGKNRLVITGLCMNQNTFSRIADGHGIIFEIISNNAPIVYSDCNVLSRKSLNYKSGELYDITFLLGKGYEYSFAQPRISNASPLCDFNKSYETGETTEFFIRPVKKLILSKLCDTQIVARGSYIKYNGKDYSESLQKAYLSLSEEEGDVFTAQENADGVYFIVDLKKERAGFLHFALHTDKKAKITVTFGEHLTDLRVRNRVSGYNFMLLHDDAEGDVEFTSYTRRIGCRYLQFFISSPCVKVKEATLILTDYPVKEILPPKSDYLINQIEKTAVHTLHTCMHEHYEDCPWREQAQYAMDTYIQILSGFYAFDNKEFAAASLRLFAHDLNEKGFLYITTPCRVDQFIPCFSLAFIMTVNAYTEFYADESLFYETSESVKTILDSMASYIDESGVVKVFGGWNFYEWTDGLSNPANQDYHAPLNFLFVKALSDAANLFGKTGDAALSKKYASLAKSVAAAANKLFYNSKTKLFASYSMNGKQSHYAEYTQALAVYSKVADEKQTEKICEVLSSNNDLVKLSLSNYIFKYCALLDTSDKYKEYVLEDIKERWGKMLFAGATTFWETEEGDAFSKAISLCHGWSSLPVYIINRYKLV